MGSVFHLKEPVLYIHSAAYKLETSSDVFCCWAFPQLSAALC